MNKPTSLRDDCSILHSGRGSLAGAYQTDKYYSFGPLQRSIDGAQDGLVHSLYQRGQGVNKQRRHRIFNSIVAVVGENWYIEYATFNAHVSFERTTIRQQDMIHSTVELYPPSLAFSTFELCESIPLRRNLCFSDLSTEVRTSWLKLDALVASQAEHRNHGPPSSIEIIPKIQQHMSSWPSTAAFILSIHIHAI